MFGIKLTFFKKETLFFSKGLERLESNEGDFWSFFLGQCRKAKAWLACSRRSDRLGET